MKKTNERLSRCRWCDRDDVPSSEIVVGHIRPDGVMSGVCRKCFNDPKAEARYHKRMMEGVAAKNAEGNLKLEI